MTVFLLTVILIVCNPLYNDIPHSCTLMLHVSSIQIDIIRPENSEGILHSIFKIQLHIGYTSKMGDHIKH